MLIVVGLCNPGPKYAGNRHNIGYPSALKVHEEQKDRQY